MTEGIGPDLPFVFRTGVDALDRALAGGFGPGVHVVLARHSAGSTALGLQVAEGALKEGLRVLLVGDDDFLRSAPRRLAALRAGVGLHPDGSFRDGPEGLSEAWASAADGLVTLLSTSTASNPPPVDVGQRVLEEVVGRRPAVVIVDGLQPTQMVVEDRGKALMAAARAAADRWKLPVVVTGHLLAISRSARESTAGKRPTLDHVGEHRALFESAADTMLLLNRPSMDLFDDSATTPEDVAATLVRRGEAPVDVDFRWSRVGSRFI